MIAATFTAEPLQPGLRLMLDAAGLALEVKFAPYNQVLQELLMPRSSLAANAGGINVILVRVEDFVRDARSAEEARVIIPRLVSDLCAALNKYIQRIAVPTILAAMAPSDGVAAELMPDIDAATKTILAHARNLPSLTLLSDQDIDVIVTRQRYDAAGDQLAHMPFSEEYYATIAAAIVRKVHALRVAAHKVLVLDCDETLWRGVVGEDGVDGIEIPPQLALLQRFAVRIQGQGVLICLVSKNAERDVLEVFEQRSDMVLQLDQVVARRINWESKPRNISSLARALNLGLDSFVFIDDNPVECAMMRSELPQVVTLQLPPDDEIESFLSNLWTFDKIEVTKEDVRRTVMYRENAARQEFEESSTDIAAFIASLEVNIDIAAPEEGEWPRLAQLTQRTNQFNFTTMRRAERELRALVSDGTIVWRVKVSDRFGDYGVVGLVIVKAGVRSLVVDTFLLSCRVLGRGVEHAILRRLGELAAERVLAEIDVPYVITPKNEPARAFIDSVAAPFRLEEEGRVVYRIPRAAASGIAHQPGHDPKAVIEARKADERKAATPSASGGAIERSERYIKLARTLTSGAAIMEAVRANAAGARILPTPPVRAATPSERMLAELWRKYLGIEGLGVEDNYFALGGTSLVAARLFAEIAQRFGVVLPLTSILEAPTIRALARFVEVRRPVGRERLIELKPGGPRYLFLVHDGDGETLLYRNLARRMPADVGVYGIEPLSAANIPLAHANIEDMAAYYISLVRGKQPKGPYLLGGMCAGGVIAYEMAAQLKHVDENAEALILLDAAAPHAQKRRGLIAKTRLSRLRRTLSDTSAGGGRLPRAARVSAAVLRKLTNTARWEIAHRIRLGSVWARFGLLRTVLERKISWPTFIPGLTVREIYDCAEAHYRPTLISGMAVVLVLGTAGEGDDTPYREIYSDETLGWRRLAHNLIVLDVLGGHSSMLQEQCVDSLADSIAQYISRKESLPDAITDFEATAG